MELRANHHHNLQSITMLILVILLLEQWPSNFCSARRLQLEATGGDEKENSSGQVDVHMEKWMLWNLRKYYRMKRRSYFLPLRNEDAVVVNRRGQEQIPGGLDPKLRIAEMNRYGISVSQDGNGDFNTIQQALDSIPPYNERRVLICIKPGVYREKIHIPRSLPFVTFIGDSSDPPKITGNDTAWDSGRDGLPLKTFRSATVAVDADYFVAVNVAFENTATHVVGSVGGQGVALRISGTKAAFFNCSFYGSQDTLYDHRGLHYFKNCIIQGSVDFIFGYGRSLYESCHLNSVAQKVASLTAQKRSNSSLESGFSFTNCTVTGSGSVYLGRAWGDYSRVIFSYSFLDRLVLPQGWNDWGKTIRDSRVYYGEYKCSGPGANMTRRVPWARTLTEEEALPFIGTYYIDAHSWLLDPPTT